MDIKKATDIGFKPKTSLRDGINKTIEWFINSKVKNIRYNSFTEKI